MYFRNQFRLYSRPFRDPAGQDGDKGGAGEPTPPTPPVPPTPPTPPTPPVPPTDPSPDLTAQLAEERAERKKLADSLRAAEERLAAIGDVDPGVVKQLLAEKKRLETEDLEKRGQWEALKKQMVDAHAAEVSRLSRELGEFRKVAENNQSLIEKLTVGHAFDNSGFIRDEMALTPRKARIIYGDYFDIENGQVVAFDKPRNASGRVQLVDGKGEPLGFEAAIAKLVNMDPDRDHLLRSKMKVGAGSTTTTAKAKEPKQELRGIEKISSALKSAGKS